MPISETLSTKVHTIRTIEYVSEDRVRLNTTERVTGTNVAHMSSTYQFETDTPVEPFVPGEAITVTVQRGEE